MHIIFTVAIDTKEIVFGNSSFKDFFQFDIPPYIYIEESLLSRLIFDGVKEASEKNIGKSILEYYSKTYLFNFEKVTDNLVIFSGQRYHKDNHMTDINSHKILKLLADNLPDMLWAKDPEGNYLYANKSLCKNLLSATDTKEPLGKNDVFFALREREKHKANKEWHTFGEMCFNSDEVVLENMKSMVFEESGNVQGKHMVLEVHKAPFIDENGFLLGTIGSGRDITEEIQTKRELKDKSDLLIQQSKMAQLGEILENIAHQWRHPLSMISMVISTASMQKAENMEVDLDYVFENVLKATQHLSGTIDDFRDFFKEDKAKTHFLLNKTFQESLSLFRVKFNINNIEIVRTCEEFMVYGYRRELIQVFMNLLSNAIDAIEDNISDFESRFIFISIYKEADYGVVKLGDSGLGISEDIIPKIFNPKFTTKGEVKGTGIGLYMVREIVENHMNGSITVSNTTFIHKEKSYKGAEFTIKIPLE